MALKEKDGSTWGGLLEAAREIGRKRQDVLQQMKAAYERGDDAEALRLGKELCGIEDEHTRN